MFLGMRSLFFLLPRVPAPVLLAPVGDGAGLLEEDLKVWWYNKNAAAFARLVGAIRGISIGERGGTGRCQHPEYLP